jgi:hypothetical protein
MAASFAARSLATGSNQQQAANVCYASNRYRNGEALKPTRRAKKKWHRSKIASVGFRGFGVYKQLIGRRPQSPKARIDRF